MKGRLNSLVVVILLMGLVASACAPAATPEPTKAPAAPPKAAETSKPAGEATKPPAATKAPEPAKPAAEPGKPAAAKPPIKIGYLAPLTGFSAQQGLDMKDGFALYLDQKGGSLGGRKVELLVEDDEMNPQVGLTKAKKLVERDNVHMLAGVVSSAVAYSLADYVKAQKIPLFLNNAGADDLTQQRFTPYFFRNSFSNSQQVHPLGEWAYRKGYRNVVIVTTDFAAGYETMGGFARTFTEAGGKVVQELYLPQGAPDPSPFITAIKPDADVVFAFQIGTDALHFVPAYEQYGLKKRIPLIGYSSLTDESILPKEGDSALGIVTAATWAVALDTPANKAFSAAFEKKFNREVTRAASYGYEAAMMLDKALQATSGDIEDRDTFIKAFEKVEIPDSPRGPVKFDKYHNVILNVYITETRKVAGKLANVVIETFKDVSQFWKWSPEEFLKMPVYGDLKGKWAK